MANDEPKVYRNRGEACCAYCGEMVQMAQNLYTRAFRGDFVSDPTRGEAPLPPDPVHERIVRAHEMLMEALGGVDLDAALPYAQDARKPAFRAAVAAMMMEEADTDGE